MSDFLKKKKPQHGLSANRGIAPMQGVQGVMPSMGVQGSALESLGNTKAKTLGSIPTGVPHAKVMTAPKNLKHGKYL